MRKQVCKIVSLLTAVGILTACGNDNKNRTANFELVVEGKNTFSKNKPLAVAVKNKSNEKIDSIAFFIDKNHLASINGKTKTTLQLEKEKLGKQSLQALVYADGEETTIAKTITLLAAKKPKLYTYKVIKEYPHDINAYTQGLEFSGDTLFESTGQRGKSSLRKTDYKTGDILQKVDLGKQYFGEGLTILKDKIYQLTWQNEIGFIYNRNTLKKTGSFVYGESKEGWGLCNDGSKIYKSDGTEKIWILNPENLQEEAYLQIYTNNSRIKSVNELEWVNGKIYANVYTKNAIAIINPEDGTVEGVIDVNGLQRKVKQHPRIDVLNGIAYKGDENKLFVTGKNWNKLFEIEIVEK